MKDKLNDNPNKEKEITLRVRVIECVIKNVTVNATDETDAINKIADMYGNDFIELV